MNKAIKIIAGLGALAALAACNQRAEYTSCSFVVAGTSYVEAAEDAGSITIPVHAYAKNGNVAFPDGVANTTLTFEVINGEAVMGEDFTVVPADGIVSFSGTSDASIQVNVINHPGVFTGDQRFTIRITGATDGYSVGGMNEISVVITDKDHPLANIFGTYTANNVTDAFGDTYNISTTVAAVSGTQDQVSFTNLLPYLASLGYSAAVVGVVSDDHSTITIQSGQVVDNVAYFYAVSQFEGSSVYFGESLVFEVDETAGTLTMSSPGYAAYNNVFYDLIYSPGLVFTKQ